MTKLSLVIAIVLTGCGKDETTDQIHGDFYSGEIDAKKLADNVKEVKSSTLTVDFSICDRDGQCAEIDFDGELTVIGITVEGSPPQMVHGVIINGDTLFCEMKAGGYILTVEGIFTGDRTVLDASVSTPVFGQPVFLGTVHLVREETNDTAESETGGDTGTDSG